MKTGSGSNMINSGNTVFYAASSEPLKDQEFYCLAYAGLSPERRKKVDSYRFEKDKRLSICAEMLLQYALREANVDTASFRVKNDPFGKPILCNTDRHFNLSHSGEWAICAFSELEVGCDIEKINHADLAIAERFFCPEEYAHISGQTSPAGKDLLFFRYWTLKESFIKAVGLGLTLPLDSFQIRLGERIRVEQSLDQRSYSFAEFGTIPGYCCALCGIGEITKVQLKIIDLRDAVIRSRNVPPCPFASLKRPFNPLTK